MIGGAPVRTRNRGAAEVARRTIARHPVIGAAIWLAASWLCFELKAGIFHPSLDEGIYLEGGARVLAGQAPYKDFFAFTGPLVYWVQAVCEALFGRNLPLLRLPMAISFGAMAASVYWAAAALRARGAALAAAAAFTAFTLANQTRFVAGHRWLSAALLMLAAAAALWAVRGRAARLMWCCAGAAAAAAAWATPAFLPAAAFLAVWLPWKRERRRMLVFFAGGAMLVSLPAAAWLAAHGALGPMLHAAAWTSRQYSRANRVMYGYMPHFAFSGPGSAVSAVRWLFFPVCMPLLLAVSAWLVARRRWKTPEALLAALALFTLLTAYPRWDVNQLIYVTAPFYVLMAILLWDVVPPRARPLTAAAAVGLAALFAVQPVLQADAYVYFPTRAGMLRRNASDAMALEQLEKLIPERSSLFVFPYMPLMGYLLNTRNPSAYSFLQPGMMAAADEAAALAQLEADPPDHVLLQYLPEAQVLEVWPNSDRSRLELASICAFFSRRYAEAAVVESANFRLFVLRRVDGPLY